MWTNKVIGAAIAAAAAFGGGCSSSENPKPPPAANVAPAKTGVALHETWKNTPLSEAAGKGLKWLVSVQGADGGWGQDGGSDGNARDGIKLETTGNDVANTALVCLALLRAGHTPAEGEYRDALRKGLDFILKQVESAPADGLAITTRQGTQIQRKLGPYIDTFLSSMLLSEVDGRMADAAAQKRVRDGLGKVVAKVEKNQQKDGSWNYAGGWAPVLGTSIASRSLYVADAKGVKVDPSCFKRLDDYTKGNFHADKNEFSSREAGAGVELYQAAQALEQVSRTKESRDENRQLIASANGKLSAQNFVAGFGSMGGEEFVSYMNISDSLLRTGGKEWTDWNGKIKEHLVKLQNQDGTWAGHHCITGRVACTSSAVMTLLAERTAPKM